MRRNNPTYLLAALTGGYIVAALRHLDWHYREGMAGAEERRPSTRAQPSRQGANKVSLLIERHVQPENANLKYKAHVHALHGARARNHWATSEISLDVRRR